MFIYFWNFCSCSCRAVPLARATRAHLWLCASPMEHSQFRLSLRRRNLLGLAALWSIPITIPSPIPNSQTHHKLLQKCFLTMTRVAPVATCRLHFAGPQLRLLWHQALLPLPPLPLAPLPLWRTFHPLAATWLLFIVCSSATFPLSDWTLWKLTSACRPGGRRGSEGVACIHTHTHTHAMSGCSCRSINRIMSLTVTAKLWGVLLVPWSRLRGCLHARISIDPTTTSKSEKKKMTAKTLSVASS